MIRTKEEISNYLIDQNAWSDGDFSRKAHQLDILIEVLVDIRDILDRGTLNIVEVIEKIKDKL